MEEGPEDEPKGLVARNVRQQLLGGALSGKQLLQSDSFDEDEDGDEDDDDDDEGDADDDDEIQVSVTAPRHVKSAVPSVVKPAAPAPVKQAPQPAPVADDDSFDDDEEEEEEDDDEYEDDVDGSLVPANGTFARPQLPPVTRAPQQQQAVIDDDEFDDEFDEEDEDEEDGDVGGGGAGRTRNDLSLSVSQDTPGAVPIENSADVHEEYIAGALLLALGAWMRAHHALCVVVLLLAVCCAAIKAWTVGDVCRWLDNEVNRSSAIIVRCRGLRVTHALMCCAAEWGCCCCLHAHRALTSVLFFSSTQEKFRVHNIDGAALVNLDQRMLTEVLGITTEQDIVKILHCQAMLLDEYNAESDFGEDEDVDLP